MTELVRIRFERFGGNPAAEHDDGGERRAMKYTFTAKRGETLKLSADACAEAFDKVAKPLGCAFRVHPKVAKFASDHWAEATRRLRFENPTRTWDQCSREIMAREPWVLLSRGEVGEFNEYDIDLREAGDHE